MNLKAIQTLLIATILCCISGGLSQNIHNSISSRMLYQPNDAFYRNPFAIFLATSRPPVQSSNQPPKESNPPNQDDQECTCGIKNTENRIVGGKETKPLEYPWMVAIYVRGSYVCGGTLIYENIVLTAAHCIIPYLRRFYTVKLSIHNLNADRGVIAEVLQIDVHPRYDEERLRNDIALITLRSTFSVTPVCLNTNNNDLVGSKGLVLGWGRTSEYGQLPKGLQEVNIEIINRDQCSKVLPFIYEYNICTKEDGKDACQGDSGGPLVNLFDGKHYTQTGIISWGVGCARPDYPGVYTGVSYFIPWIEGTIGRKFYTCQSNS